MNGRRENGEEETCETQHFDAICWKLANLSMFFWLLACMRLRFFSDTKDFLFKFMHLKIGNAIFNGLLCCCA
jgi:uncharacterized membrane-anchored protein